MIATASVLGFALVFFLIGWGLSLLAGAVLRALRASLGAAGCAVERCAAALALVAPPLLALTFVLILAARSVYEGRSLHGDHCLSHGHHAHLCLLHGQAWGQRLSVWSIAIGMLGLGLWRGARWLRAAVRVQSLLRRLEPIASADSRGPVTIWQVPAQTPFCLVTGLLRPRIVWSTGARELLTPVERSAVLSHEAAHLVHGDLWRRLLLGFAAALGAPYIARRALSAWEHASERLCDRRAAEAVGDATAVASALVKLSRASGAPLPGTASFLPAARLEERVRALLDAPPPGERSARRLRRAACWLLVLALPVLAAMADPLHHTLETLLGML